MEAVTESKWGVLASKKDLLEYDHFHGSLYFLSNKDIFLFVNSFISVH